MLQKQRSIGDIDTAGRVLRFPLSLHVWIKAALEEGEEEAGSASHLSNVPQWLRSTEALPQLIILTSPGTNCTKTASSAVMNYI